MISHKHKFLSIRIPKTASTSVTTALNSYFDIKGTGDRESVYYYHTKAELIKDHFVSENWDYNSYFKFAFVRNPFARIVSAFFYLRNTELRFRCDRQVRNELGLLKMDFKQFVKEKLLDTSYMHFNQIIGKSIMSCDLDKFDFIGKTENMQTDCDEICDLIKRPKRVLPYTNESKHKHYTEYYDDETRQIVAGKYAKDIEMFGYEFGE